MKEFNSLGLRYTSRRLEVLDQRLLPHEEVWRTVDHPHEMERLIKQLSIRGAPLIGVGAAIALALFAIRGATTTQITDVAQILRNARPTAINLMYSVDAVMEKIGDPTAMEATAEWLLDSEIQSSLAMARYGADLIQDGEGLITHCNTGGLATVGIGTALAAIRYAHEQGKNVHVYVDETRPLMQGARLTCWELNRLKIPYTLICDNMAALVLRDGRAKRAFVGADRIAMNGDFANKVGTYGLAVLCHHHEVPFHSVAPVSTVDFSCSSGEHIPIEQRSADEVRGVKGFSGESRWSLPHAPAYNPSFDVTPAHLVTSLVLDSGVYDTKMLSEGVLKTLNPLQGALLCGE